MHGGKKRMKFFVIFAVFEEQLMEGPTNVCWLCSVDIACPSLTVFASSALYNVVKTGRKRKLPIGGAARRK